MKFIADAMLGRLSKWLRILGFDVLYYPDIEDRELVRLAREQERTILTRDTGLMKRRGLPGVIFVDKDDVFDQLVLLRERLGFDQAALSGRCAVCNGVIDVVHNKEEVRDLVPEYIYLNLHEFMRCRDCGRVYWEGSHHRDMMDKIRGILSSVAVHSPKEGEN